MNNHEIWGINASVWGCMQWQKQWEEPLQQETQ